MWIWYYEGEQVNRRAHISSIIWLERLYKVTVNHFAMSESVPRVPEINSRLVQAVQMPIWHYTEGRKAQSGRFRFTYLTGLFIFL